MSKSTFPSGHERPERKRTRLAGHAYRAGSYFITQTVEGRHPLFGNVIGGIMRLNPAGQAVADAWEWIDSHPDVDVGEYIVMPDHTHVVFTITSNDMYVSRVMTAFKQKSEADVRALGGFEGRRYLWQERFYDHVIRDQADFDVRCRYVRENPVRWGERVGQEIDITTEVLINSIGNCR